MKPRHVSWAHQLSASTLPSAAERGEPGAVSRAGGVGLRHLHWNPPPALAQGSSSELPRSRRAHLSLVSSEMLTRSPTCNQTHELLTVPGDVPAQVLVLSPALLPAVPKFVGCHQPGSHSASSYSLIPAPDL